MNRKRNRGEDSNKGEATIRTIVIAEDDKGLARLIEKTLEREGFSTRKCSSGAETIATLLDHPGEILMLDYRLPDMTGKAVVESLVRQHCKVPFIIITGHGNEKIAVEMMKLGARDYLIKEEGFLDLLPPVVRQVADQLATERKLVEAEKALRESEEQYRTLVELCPDAVTVTDLEGNIVACNQQAVNLYGCKDTSELIGKNAFELIVPEDRKKAEENARRTLEMGATRDLEYGLLREDGSTYTVELNASLLTDGEGNPRGFIGSVRDITERKQAEEKLRASQDYARNLVDSSMDMIIAVDNERRITEFNNAAEETFGYLKEDVLGESVSILYADPEEGHSVHKTTVEKGKWVQEIMNRRKSGEIFPSLLSASVLRDSGGKGVGVMGVSRDITEQKRAEEELKERMNELERFQRLVVDRELKMIELKKKIKELERRIHGDRDL